jgi:hypothetical protein
MEEVLSAGRMGWPEWMARPAAWLRGLGGTRAAAATLRVEARLSLGAKKSLVLVNCRGRQVLLALSGDTVSPVVDFGETPRKTGAKGAGR